MVRQLIISARLTLSVSIPGCFGRQGSYSAFCVGKLSPWTQNFSLKIFSHAGLTATCAARRNAGCIGRRERCRRCFMASACGDLTEDMRRPRRNRGGFTRKRAEKTAPANKCHGRSVIPWIRLAHQAGEAGAEPAAYKPEGTAVLCPGPWRRKTVRVGIRGRRCITGKGCCGSAWGGNSTAGDPRAAVRSGRLAKCEQRRAFHMLGLREEIHRARAFQHIVRGKALGVPGQCGRIARNVGKTPRPQL